jgi:hypothetical protein
VTIFDSIGISSGIFSACIITRILSRRYPLRSSSRDMKNCEEPGSPCRPDALGVVVYFSSLLAFGPYDIQAAEFFHLFRFFLHRMGFLQVLCQRRARHVRSNVTAPFRPAWAITEPSFSWFLAFSISYLTPALLR